MLYTVFWKVNDGGYGYPNIEAEFNWGSYKAQGYLAAIHEHAARLNVNLDKNSPLVQKEINRGKIRGYNYREYIVSYLGKDKYNTRIDTKIRIVCEK